MFTRLINKLRIIYLQASYRHRLELSEGVIIDPKSSVIPLKGKIKIKKNALLRSNPRGYHAGMPFSTTLFTDIDEAIIEIGENCRINGAYIHAQKKIVIGDNTVIASGVHIIDSNGHALHSMNRTIERDEPQQIIIGLNVWIGLNAIVLKGSVIGDNSVVGAGSIVKGNFPENSLIVGNPASVVKSLLI